MLFKTIARKMLELKDHKIYKVEETKNGMILIYISAKKQKKLKSSCCKKRRRVVDLLSQRRWSHLSLWGRKVEIIYSPSRVECCGKLVVEDIPWSMGKWRLTVPLSIFNKLRQDEGSRHAK